MDSKLKRKAMFLVLLTILCILLIVAAANRERIFPKDSSRDVIKVETDEQKEDGQIGDDLKGFLSDNTFFDKEKTSYNVEASLNRLSMVVTSVEKDLRIQVVDIFGELVADESFYVNVDGVGEYKDLDKDGVIYIADLKPGEYSVSLKAMDGYQVPENSTKIRVKEQVEYVPIGDISLLMKTEEDINAKEEDSGIKDALSDTDNTENKKHHTTDSTCSLGIDVSKWNGEIDWDKVKNDGIEFVMIRCGYRGSVTGALVEDPMFLQNIKGAKASGLKVGVYFFTQAVNEVEAVEEASMVLALCDGISLDYPVIIDSEGAGGNGRADDLDIETRTLVCDAFCKTVENAGYTAGVYASRSWYNQKLDTDKLNDYKIWLAEYRKTPLYSGYYDMWQYTSKGTVKGINGKVDLNISYH